jgi:hypothetical protein
MMAINAPIKPKHTMVLQHAHSSPQHSASFTIELDDLGWMVIVLAMDSPSMLKEGIFGLQLNVKVF